MRKLVLTIFLLFMLAIPASASSIVAPPVPDDVEELIPSEDWELGNGVITILKRALAQMQPQVASGIKTVGQITGIILVFSAIRNMDGKSKSVTDLGCILAIAYLLLEKSSSMLERSAQTITDISQYGKLLLPALTAALAAQGGSISAAGLYSATCIFDAALSSVISTALVPLVYIFLILSIMNAVTGDELLAKARNFIKWAVTWCLKLVLYVFTGYISISGIIAGGADQTAIKATKLTISGMIPVVGGILSDASETILISAGIVKNTIGIYGLLSVIAITIIPILEVGVVYLSMKFSFILASVFAPKTIATLLEDLSSAMGLLMGMIGSVCLLQMISIVCFLKGMS